MAEKNVITKSVCFPRTAEFEEFVAKQKNFSRTMCILVQQSIFQHGGKIVDVLEEYESVSRDIVFRRQISELSKTMEENEGGLFLVDENPTIPAEEDHRGMTAFPRGTNKRLLSRHLLCGIIEVGGEAHGAVQI